MSNSANDFFRFKNFKHANELGFGKYCLSIGHKGLKFSKMTKIKPENSHKTPMMSSNFGYTGIKDWRKMPPLMDGDINNLDTFERRDGCGIGFRGMGDLIGIDIDSERIEFVEAVKQLSNDIFGVAPVRYRDSSNKILLLLKADNSEGVIGKIRVPLLPINPDADNAKDEAVEVLADGQQFVVDGYHPSGNCKWNCEPNFAALPLAKSSEMNKFFEGVINIIKDMGLETKQEIKLHRRTYGKNSTIIENVKKVIDLPDSTKLYALLPPNLSPRTITAKELVEDPSKYDECVMKLPLEPEYNNGQVDIAKFYANESTSKPLIHSFAHSGIAFRFTSVDYRDYELPFSDEEEELLSDIRYRVELILGKSSAVLNDSNIIECWRYSFYSHQKKTIYVVDRGDGSLKEFSTVDFKDRTRIRNKLFGSFYDGKALEDKLNMLGSDKKEIDKIRKSWKNCLIDIIYEDLVSIHQCNSVSFKVDMFAEEHTMIFENSVATIIARHNAFVENDFDIEVINDFKEHFPNFDQFITFQCDSRFASDRKNAYMWFQACSDWGKNLLMSVFKELGLLVEIQVNEIEKIMDGSPSGKSHFDFNGKWILFVDEFKRVNSEIKMLANYMQLSPKNKLQIEVPLYSKIFASAEHVNSLAGEEGVEKQFANRFCKVPTKNGAITERDLFNTVGKTHYFNSLVGYVGKTLNEQVASYRKLGYNESTIKADEQIKLYHDNNSLEDLFGSNEESIERIANEIRGKLFEFATGKKKMYSEYFSEDNVIRKVYYKDEYWILLRSPQSIVLKYIDSNIAKNQQAMLKHKSLDIAKCIDQSGRKNILSSLRVKNCRNDGQFHECLPKDLIRPKGVLVKICEETE